MKKIIIPLLLSLFLAGCAARPILIPSDRQITKLPDGRISISEGYFLEFVEELNRCGR